jgi:hypothetical protein
MRQRLKASSSKELVFYRLMTAKLRRCQCFAVHLKSARIRVRAERDFTVGDRIFSLDMVAERARPARVERSSRVERTEPHEDTGQTAGAQPSRCDPLTTLQGLSSHALKNIAHKAYCAGRGSARPAVGPAPPWQTPGSCAPSRSSPARMVRDGASTLRAGRLVLIGDAVGRAHRLARCREPRENVAAGRTPNPAP